MCLCFVFFVVKNDKMDICKQGVIMLCYAYGVNFMDSDKFLTTLYCGMDENEAIRIAKENKSKFSFYLWQNFIQEVV